MNISVTLTTVTPNICLLGWWTAFDGREYHVENLAILHGDGSGGEVSVLNNALVDADSVLSFDSRVFALSPVVAEENRTTLKPLCFAHASFNFIVYRHVAQDFGRNSAL